MKISKRFSLKQLQRLYGGAFLCIAAAPAAFSYGGYYGSVLQDQTTLLQPPNATFAYELGRIAPVHSTELSASIARWDATYSQTEEKGWQDVVDELFARGVNEDTIQRIADEWSLYRTALDDWRERQAYGSSVAPRLPSFPQGLPEQFELYLKGAGALHYGNHERARWYWRKIFELPYEENAYRGTWAAYMIGRSLVDENPADAVVWLRYVRTLVEHGYADSLGLGAASLGWEAKAEWNRKNYSAAARLYLAQLQSGYGNARTSLLWLAGKTFGEVERFPEFAEDPGMQPLVTARFLSHMRRGIPADAAAAWLEALHHATRVEPVGAERVAWLAYHCDQERAEDFSRTRYWLSRTNGENAIASWLRAKLALHDGERGKALEHLRTASAIFAQDAQEAEDGSYPEEYWLRRSRFYVQTEIGALELARGNFAESLREMLRAYELDSDFWTRAAYVADAVMTVEELAEFCRTEKGLEEGTMSTLRDLLARRYVRAKNYSAAAQYFSSPLRKVLADYGAHIETGNDIRQPAQVRAEAYWQAALIARHQGIDLIATEVGPDWQAYHGSSMASLPRQHDMSEHPLLKPLPEESERVAASRPEPDRRFHYRYIAADFAWQALELMPDNDDETARRFIIAGSWLKAKDPQSADRFYKALVNRCRQTDLGREADRRRWFPPLP